MAKRIWRESQHPRDGKGRFAKRGGAAWVKRAAAELTSSPDSGATRSASGRPQISRSAKAGVVLQAHTDGGRPSVVRAPQAVKSAAPKVNLTGFMAKGLPTPKKAAAPPVKNLDAFNAPDPPKPAKKDWKADAARRMALAQERAGEPMDMPTVSAAELNARENMVRDMMRAGALTGPTVPREPIKTIPARAPRPSPAAAALIAARTEEQAPHVPAMTAARTSPETTPVGSVSGYAAMKRHTLVSLARAAGIPVRGKSNTEMADALAAHDQKVKADRAAKLNPSGVGAVDTPRANSQDGGMTSIEAKPLKAVATAPSGMVLQTFAERMRGEFSDAQRLEMSLKREEEIQQRRAQEAERARQVEEARANDTRPEREKLKEQLDQDRMADSVDMRGGRRNPQRVARIKKLEARIEELDTEDRKAQIKGFRKGDKVKTTYNDKTIEVEVVGKTSDGYLRVLLPSGKRGNLHPKFIEGVTPAPKGEADPKADAAPVAAPAKATWKVRPWSGDPKVSELVKINPDGTETSHSRGRQAMLDKQRKEFQAAEDRKTGGETPAPSVTVPEPPKAQAPVKPDVDALLDRYRRATDRVSQLDDDDMDSRSSQAAYRELREARAALVAAGVQPGLKGVDTGTPGAASARSRISPDAKRGALANAGATEIGATEIKPGDQLLYTVGGKSVPTTVVSGPEEFTDRFGQKMMRFQARREDTGKEGAILFGPTGVALRVDAPQGGERGAIDTAAKRTANLEKARAAATEKKVSELRDSTDPKDNSAKIRAITDDRMGAVDLYRQAHAGPSGQRSNIRVGTVRHTPDNQTGEYTVTGTDGETSGYVTATVRGGESKYAVYSDSGDGGTELLGWADSLAHAADVLNNGEAAASTGGTLDARRISGRLFERNPNRNKSLAELERDALDREIAQTRESLANPRIGPQQRASAEKRLARLEAERRGEPEAPVDTPRVKSQNSGMTPKPSKQQERYTVGKRVEVEVTDFETPGFPKKWVTGTVDEARMDDNGRMDVRVRLDNPPPSGGEFAGRQIVGTRGGNKQLRPLDGGTTVTANTPQHLTDFERTGPGTSSPETLKAVRDDTNAPANWRTQARAELARRGEAASKATSSARRAALSKAIEPTAIVAYTSFDTVDGVPGEIPGTVELRTRFPDRKSAEAFIATMPKTLGLRLEGNDAVARVDTHGNANRGERNETGVKRYERLVKLLTEAGATPEMGGGSAYADRAAMERVLTEGIPSRPRDPDRLRANVPLIRQQQAEWDAAMAARQARSASAPSTGPGNVPIGASDADRRAARPRMEGETDRAYEVRTASSEFAARKILEGYNAAGLRSIARGEGVVTSGTKGDLVVRLLRVMRSRAEDSAAIERMVNADRVPAKAAPAPAAPRTNTPAASGPITPTMTGSQLLAQRRAQTAPAAPRMSDKPRIRNTWAGANLGGAHTGTEKLLYHHDSEVGRLIDDLGDDGQLDVGGDSLANQLGRLATRAVREEITAADLATGMRALAAQLPDGHPARRRIDAMVDRELSGPDTPMPDVPAGTDPILVDLVRELHSIPVVRARPGRELEPLMDIVRQYGSNPAALRSTRIGNALKALINRLHESALSRYQIDSAIQRVVDELERRRKGGQ